MVPEIVMNQKDMKLWKNLMKNLLSEEEINPTCKINSFKLNNYDRIIVLNNYDKNIVLTDIRLT